MTQKKYILLNPGPVNISERVRKALTKPDLCHREEEFVELQQSIQQKLLDLYSLDKEKYCSVLLSGSGTAAVEAALTSLCPEDGHILVVSNGVYGERIAKIASVNNFAMTEIRYDWGKDIQVADIEETLKLYSDITTIAVIHHETTTGILNNIEEIGKLAKKWEKDFFVDAVSSFGGEEINFEEWGVDICCGSSNKCIHGVPGAAFVIATKEIFERQQNMPPKSVYLDLNVYYAAQKKKSSPFTMAVHVLYAFEEALMELLESGVAERVSCYKERSGKIRELAEELKLKAYIGQEKNSSTLTSFYLPEFITYKILHDELKKKGFIIYAGQGGLYQNIFRIANMGEISFSDIDRLFEEIEKVLSRHK